VNVETVLLVTQSVRHKR